MAARQDTTESAGRYSEQLLGKWRCSLLATIVSITLLLLSNKGTGPRLLRLGLRVLPYGTRLMVYTSILRTRKEQSTPIVEH